MQSCGQKHRHRKLKETRCVMLGLNDLEKKKTGEQQTTTYRHRYGQWSGSDLGVHVHGDRNEDGHRDGYGHILPLHSIVDVCRQKSTTLEW